MDKKMLFVYNPKSGKGTIKNSLSDILEILAENEYEIIVYPTKRAGDGKEYVKEHAVSYDIIVCCGGDGTLDEVVTGLVQCDYKGALGYIPSGSTNDFANTLGIPKQMDKAARLIVNGQPRCCDLGKMNDAYFVYVAAFGFIADVSYQTTQEMKNSLGYVAYVIEAIKQMRNWKVYHLQVRSEEFCDEGDYIFGMITNSDSVGGIKGINGKNNDLDDGLFEVMLIRNPQNVLDWQEVISGIITKESNKHIVMFKTSQLSVRAEEEVAWTMDGEDGGVHSLVEISNIQSAYHILC